jgi:predicted membrane protein
MKAKILATWITFFILGTIFAFYFELNPALWLTMAAVFVGSSIFTRNRIIWTLLIAIGFFFLAILLFQKQQQKYTGENLLVADQQELVGTIVDVPQETEKGVQARIGVQNKTLLAYLRPYPTVEFADKVNIKGRLKTSHPKNKTG